jgi:hypothetical protein
MTIHPFDPFDLPDWLGTHEVQWRATSVLQDAVVVHGVLRSEAARDFALDLLAVDAAYPTVSCPEQQRQAAHQAWQFGQVALVEVDGTVAAAVPGAGFDANLVCEVVRRLAKAVGAPDGLYTVSISL